MSSSDIKAKRITGVGSLAVGPARVRYVHVLVSAGTGRLTITDGDGGETVMDVDFAASDTEAVPIPDYGIRCSSDVYVSAMTNITSATIFYS